MTTGRILALCIVALSAACQRDAGVTPAAPASNSNTRASVKQGPTPAEQTAGMVEAVTLGKSQVPVAVKFDFNGRPTVGQPLEVIVAVMPQIVADPAVLAVTESQNLKLAAGSESTVIPAVQPDQVYKETVKLTPTAEGVQLLALSVSLKHDEITETRTFSVPVIVGAKGD